MRKKEEKKEKKPKIVILKRLYSVANPIIEHLPGRTIDEKRTIFNMLMIFSVLLFYLSPLPIIIISNAHTPLGALLTGLILIPIPIAFGKYLLEVLSEYGEKWRQSKKSSPNIVKENT